MSDATSDARADLISSHETRPEPASTEYTCAKDPPVTSRPCHSIAGTHRRGPVQCSAKLIFVIAPRHSRGCTRLITLDVHIHKPRSSRPALAESAHAFQHFVRVLQTSVPPLHDWHGFSLWQGSRSSLQRDSRHGLRLPIASSPIHPPSRPKNRPKFFQTAQPGLGPTAIRTAPVRKRPNPPRAYIDNIALYTTRLCHQLVSQPFVVLGGRCAVKRVI